MRSSAAFACAIGKPTHAYTTCSLFAGSVPRMWKMVVSPGSLMGRHCRPVSLRTKFAREHRRKRTQLGHRLLVRNDDLTIARVDHEYGQQLGRRRRAGILADLMMIARPLGPALADLKGALGRIVHLAADRPLEHARIDEGRRGMSMGRRSGARLVLDEHDPQALARHIRQFVLG